MIIKYVIFTYMYQYTPILINIRTGFWSLTITNQIINSK